MGNKTKRKRKGGSVYACVCEREIGTTKEQKQSKTEKKEIIKIEKEKREKLLTLKT